MGLAEGRKSLKIRLVVSIQYRLCDRQTPSQPRRRSIYTALTTSRG